MYQRTRAFVVVTINLTIWHTLLHELVCLVRFDDCWKEEVNRESRADKKNDVSKEFKIPLSTHLTIIKHKKKINAAQTADQHFDVLFIFSHKFEPFDISNTR